MDFPVRITEAALATFSQFEQPVAMRAAAQTLPDAPIWSTLIKCYTDYVRKQNLTLTLDEGLLLEARKIALERRTSVNQMVRDYLHALVAEADRRKIARARLDDMFHRGLVEIGERTWTRDELHER